MKLRTAKNSIRLRLSQSDVREFGEKGCVEESVRTGTEAADVFTYRLVRVGDRQTVSASFSNRCLTVSVPENEADDWTASERVGIEGDQPISNGDRLSILIEKDFACLTPRAGSDDRDTFPNPASAGTC
jgi:hypothetical protein